jgi:hypothetical protein
MKDNRIDYKTERKYTRIIHNRDIVTCGLAPQAILDRLNAGEAEALAWEYDFAFLLGRGDILRFQSVVETTFWRKKAGRVSGSDNYIDKPIARNEEVIEEITLKLWKTKSKGFYFIEQ